MAESVLANNNGVNGILYRTTAANQPLTHRNGQFPDFVSLATSAEDPDVAPSEGSDATASGLAAAHLKRNGPLATVMLWLLHARYNLGGAHVDARFYLEESEGDFVHVVNGTIDAPTQVLNNGYPTHYSADDVIDVFVRAKGLYKGVYTQTAVVTDPVLDWITELKDLMRDKVVAVSMHSLSVRLEHVVVRGSKNGGIYMGPVFGWTYLWLWKVDLVNVDVSGNDRTPSNPEAHDGVYIKGVFATVKNSTFSNNGGNGINILTLGMIVDGCEISGNWKAGLVVSIYLKTIPNGVLSRVQTLLPGDDGMNITRTLAIQKLFSQLLQRGTTLIQIDRTTADGNTAGCLALFSTSGMLSNLAEAFGVHRALASTSSVLRKDGWSKVQIGDWLAPLAKGVFGVAIGMVEWPAQDPGKCNAKHG